MAKASGWRAGGGTGPEGTDHGIDGKTPFRDAPKASKAEQTIIQVNGGKTGVKDVRDLRDLLDREKAARGVLISVQPPRRDMGDEAVNAGFYEHRTIREATHCATGVYVLLSTPATSSVRAPGRIR
jgi:hypothetical protein